MLAMSIARCLAFVAAFEIGLAQPSPALAEEACDRIEQLLTTTPAPPQSAALWRLHERDLGASPPGNYDLVVIGDSLARGWPDTGFSPLHTANFGVGGDSTEHVLWRLALPEMSQLNPERVLLVIGTNNLGRGDEPCAIVAGIRKIVGSVKSTWPLAQSALLEIPPRGPDFKFNDDQRLKTNAAARQIAGLKTINVDDAITCMWSRPCGNYGDDNLHFTLPGYEILTKAVKAALLQN